MVTIIRAPPCAVCTGARIRLRGTPVSASRRNILAVMLVSQTGAALADDAGGKALADKKFIDAKMLNLEVQAREAYAVRDFPRTITYVSELMFLEPTNPKWSEMRAQVCVDGRNFPASIMDYNEALKWTPGDDLVSRARITAGLALALEGQEEWGHALKQYEESQRLAGEAGLGPDPYVANSVGNCLASMQQWEAARSAYLASASIFQASSGFRGRGGSTTARVDGAIFARTNAALMLAQLGSIPEATNELEYSARRGPGDVDARAALAALYYADGRVSMAESAWDFACNRINVGCSKYQDMDWVSRVRRWPPVMVDKLRDFVTLRSPVVASVQSADNLLSAG